MISAAFFLLIAAASEAPAKCSHDFQAMLRLDRNAFDQDMIGGWRSLAASGCELEAAELIRKWREAHLAEDPTLHWHEGQMRANVGQYEEAIVLFEASLDPASRQRWGWNLYVDGSIAFLKGDLEALRLARERLAVLPAPPELKKLKDVHGNPATVRWPMNLHILDAFIRCWGQSYKAAYGCPK
ncbi:MAG: hypothetical protein J7499_13445 [Sphingopyxis sp.]|nr:hypothetical protein [Sphingopyxis sp.]